jgi:hypothetical protein
MKLDIVAKLLNLSSRSVRSDELPCAVLRQAANEIQRLRTGLEIINQHAMMGTKATDLGMLAANLLQTSRT